MYTRSSLLQGLIFFAVFRITTDDKTSVLKIPECTVDDEGDYEVVVHTAKGEASHMFETIVNVEQPKIIQSLPEVTDVSLHQPAELKVKFDSPVESKVTWLANGVALDSTTKYNITSNEQETSLQIADIIKDDTEMVYTCKVKNIAGQVETATSLVIPSKKILGAFSIHHIYCWFIDLLKQAFLMVGI